MGSRHQVHRMISIFACLTLLCALWSPAGLRTVAFAGEASGQQTRGEDQSSSVLLGSVTISTGDLSPAFEPETTEYVIALPYDVQHLTVTAQLVDEGSWAELVYGEYYALIEGPIELELARGDSDIVISVASNDGEYYLNYTFSIRRPALAFHVNTSADTADALPGDGECMDEGGACSLRAAIMEANATWANDTIYLPADHYELIWIDYDAATGDASDDLDVLRPLTIIGEGAESTIIDASNLEDRVFFVWTHAFDLSGVTITGGTGSAGGGIYFVGMEEIDPEEHEYAISDAVFVNNMGYEYGSAIALDRGKLNLTNVRITNPDTESQTASLVVSEMAYLDGENVVFEELTGWNGAAIYNFGDITLVGAEFRNNDASDQGIILNRGTMTLTDVVFDSNSAFELGVISNEGSLTISEGVFQNNSVWLDSIIYNEGILEISRSEFHDNLGQMGGVIYNAEESELNLEEVEFVNNAGGLGGAIYNQGVVEIVQGEFIDNRAPDGGAIYNKGVIEIADSEFTGNQATNNGGAISNHGSLEIIDSRFLDNVAEDEEAPNGGGSGGAVYNTDELSLTRVEFGGNRTDGSGGAIWSGRNLRITDSYIHDNRAMGGGGLYVTMAYGQGHNVMITGTTFSYNEASQSGGGAYLVDAAVIVNSTFTGNEAATSGGGIDFSGDLLVLSHATIADNLLTDSGSGQGGQNGGTASGREVLASMNYGSKVYVVNSIIGGSDAGDGAFQPYSCIGSDWIMLLGLNIIRGEVCGIEDSEAVIDVDPLLAPLEANGGYAPTRALLPGSPAIDASRPVDPLDLVQAGALNPAWVNLDADQRGESRADQGFAVDIGAYEFPYEPYSMLTYYDPLRGQLHVRFGAKLVVDEDIAPLTIGKFKVMTHAAGPLPEQRPVTILDVRYGDDERSIVLSMSGVEETDTLEITLENHAVRFANDQSGERRHAFQQTDSALTPLMLRDALLGAEVRPLRIGDIVKALMSGTWESYLGDFQSDPAVVRYLLSLIRPQYVE